MSWRSLHSSLAWRTAVGVGVGKLCHDRRRAVSEPSQSRCFDDPPSIWSKLQSLWQSSPWYELISLGTSAHVTRLEALPTPIATAPTSSSIKRYDFVVVGNGTTGRAAVETLKQECPSASIALLDPLRKPQQRQKRVDFLQDTALSLDPRQRLIGTSTQANVGYKYAVLVATGAHGAPPPSYLIDETARPRVWELRPTVIHDDAPNHCLPPTQLRTKLLEAARKGESIGVLGSSWDALDLVVAAASVRRRAHRPALFYASAGPVSHHVPTYLSRAIARRLRQKRIQIHDRTLIRYVNSEEDASGRKNGGLQLYTARSFDFLDSNRTTVDQLIIAPDTMGPRGNAVLPTHNVPSHLDDDTRDGRFWYESWSQVSMSSNSDPSMIVCYKDDGRIAVNSELAACTGVYAAGSVAKCGNALTGHADVAGEGVHDGAVAGRVAALNMTRHYQQDSLFFSSDGPLPAVLRDAIPVWRSDVLSYDDGKQRSTSLASIGIQALCVGACDSERFATHGIWWTNQSAQQRILRLLEEDEVIDTETMTPEQRKRRRHRLKGSTKMVYGIGVVYFLDRIGRIQGVMTWGLPFAESSSHELNPYLVKRMKEIILTNGGMNSLESELDQMRMFTYLASESRSLVGLAFAESSESAHASHQLQGSLDNFPKPLHRFTDNKPMSVRSHGVLKRKDGHGQGILGEDLFSRYQEVVQDPSPPKPVSGGVGYASESAQGQKSFQAAWNSYDFQVREQRELRWDENETIARPPKEDRLWIRKGDEARSVSAADTRAAVMDSVVGVQRVGR